MSTTLDADKSTLIRDDQAPVGNQISNAVLLHTVIDCTSRLFILEFNGALRFANESVRLQLALHPNQPIDILEMGPQVFTAEDYKWSIRFAYLLSQKPYTEDYALLLLCLQTLELITANAAKEHINIPRIPRGVWEKILSENPWVSSYIDSAGDIFQGCSNLIHGNTIPAIWTLEDLDVALHTSNFSSVAQAGLRSYMEEHPSTEKFLR
ncbi:hypothetical protein DFH09DRAFT_1149567, partial [Mycena vulgaris]